MAFFKARSTILLSDAAPLLAAEEASASSGD
jgi:hypothetical protein